MAEFKPVLLTLPSLTPSLALEVLPHGLTIHRLYVQADGRTHDLVIGPEAPQDHLHKKYTNTIVGRYSNRIPVGTHILERNGITSEFTAQANENPRVSLHGGPIGFDSLPWTLVSPGSSSAPPVTLFTPTELSRIQTSSSASSYAIFRLVSPDGDQGYPETLVVEVLIALVPPAEQERKYRRPGDPAPAEDLESDLGSIVIVYRAKLDEGEKKVVTPINLTQHWGFNLDASQKEYRDSGEGVSVKNHILTIKSDRIVERDSDSLSTGSFLPSANTPHAHAGKVIGDKYPEAGYDDYYLFEPFEAAPSRIPLSSFTPASDLLKDLLLPATPSGTPNPVVELTSEKSGLKLVFQTNQQGTMFYSNGLTNTSAGARKKIHGGSGIVGQGDSYAPGSAAFLEFHNPLAAFLDPANKDKEDTLLTSDELYHNFVRCDVKFKIPKGE